MAVWARGWARRHLRFVLNLWPPFLFAGIRVTRLDQDFRAVDVELRSHWWNRNYVGTHFGGSLFAMTDPFYMLLLIENLGGSYVVWDKAASIRYRKPGKGTVRAEFRLTAAEVEEVRAALEIEPRVERTFRVRVVDASGETVAEVEKLLHVRRKG
jgi:acyl-coenzyme A thioesterase PaaI-like protein